MDMDAPEDNPDKALSAQPTGTLSKKAARAQAKKLKIQRSTRVTSKQIDEISFTRRLTKERERALLESKNKDAKEALQSVSNKEVALSTATSMAQIDKASEARGNATEAIRQFNKSPSLVKLKRTQRHRTNRAWAKMASNIRDNAIQNTICSASTQNPAPPKTDPTTGYCTCCHERGRKTRIGQVPSPSDMHEAQARGA